MKDGWSATYMGAVSYKKLVSTTVTSTFSPRTEKSSKWLGVSSNLRASSMLAKRSPRLLPMPMAAKEKFKDGTFEIRSN